MPSSSTWGRNWNSRTWMLVPRFLKPKDTWRNRNGVLGRKAVRNGERERTQQTRGTWWQNAVSLMWWSLPRSQIIGDAWYDWLSCGCWWRAESACGWVGRQSSRLCSSDFREIWGGVQLGNKLWTSLDLGNWGPAQCVWGAVIQVI